MKRFILFMLVLESFSIPFVFGQKTEKQVSFSQISKPHAYYVEQAELWWKEIKKNPSEEIGWFNYFVACRNAQGTAGWSKDFVKESPYLKSGPDIVKLIEEKIPGTFVHNYVVWYERGFDPTKGPYLLKAYSMNPDFPGIHAMMATYTESEFDFALRKTVNQKWFSRNEMSPGLLAYGYNALMSVELDGILLTQHDNDTYPLWMLQDVKAVRPDVTVINLDMLLIKSYRDNVFASYCMGLMDADFDESNPLNLEQILNHILSHYHGSMPLYVGLTIDPQYYQKFSDKLYLSGLALKFSYIPIDLLPLNRDLLEKKFLLDNLGIQFSNDPNQSHVSAQNLNYLKCFKTAFDDYRDRNENDKMSRIAMLATLIAQNSEDQTWIDRIRQMFSSLSEGLISSKESHPQKPGRM
jgi:hypothetical protein